MSTPVNDRNNSSIINKFKKIVSNIFEVLLYFLENVFCKCTVFFEKFRCILRKIFLVLQSFQLFVIFFLFFI